MLSAICAPKLRQARANKGKLLITNFALSRKYDAANGAVLAERGDLYGDQGKPGAAKDFVEAFEGIAKDLAQDAFRSSLHHSFTWDLSQNVTRAPFRSATVGVCGCVTPGGELILPHKGRTLMGYEKLLLQGIPFSRLLLGPETEVQ